MALPTNLRGNKLLIKVDQGDGVTFVHPCLISLKRGLQFRTTTQKNIIYDCDNPDAPGIEQLIKDSVGLTATGAGKLDAAIATVQFWSNWALSENPKTCQLWLSNIGKWVASMHLTDFRIDGERSQTIDVSLTLESTDAITPFA